MPPVSYGSIIRSRENVYSPNFAGAASMPGLPFLNRSCGLAPYEPSVMSSLALC